MIKGKLDKKSATIAFALSKAKAGSNVDPGEEEPEEAETHEE